MSLDIINFLHSKGIATSRTTPYNPQANGQVERLNGVLWKTITLALKSKELPTEYWETVLHDALHSIRSLLNVATNCTPHERLFAYNRKATTGPSLPSWLLTPGPVLLKRFARSSKYEPLMDQVELLHCNPSYAHVRLANGREETVSLKHLAPVPEDNTEQRSDSIIDDTHLILPESESTPAIDTPNHSSEAQPTHQQPSTLYPELLQQQRRLHSYNLRNREA